MKKLIVLAAILVLAACQQKTEREVSATETTETTTISTATVDTAMAAEAADDVKDAAKDAAHETGTAMETAGKEIQERTKTD